jgi:hypothetical protein
MATARPDFISSELFRSYLSTSVLSKHIMIGGVGVGGYVSRRERLGNPVRYKIYDGGKRYRILDLVACAKADALEVTPPKEQKLVRDIEELQRYKAELLKDIEYLSARSQEAKHILATQDTSIKLTGKTLLTEAEIVQAQLTTPTTSGVYFLIKDNKVVYVGQSTQIFARIMHHVSTKDFDTFSYVECGKEMLDVMESLYIHTIRPPLNGKQNHDRRVPTAPITLDKLLTMARHK